MGCRLLTTTGLWTAPAARFMSELVRNLENFTLLLAK